MCMQIDGCSRSFRSAVELKALKTRSTLSRSLVLQEIRKTESDEYTLGKKGSKRVLRLSPIREAFFDSRYNYFGFHVEPSVERVQHGTKRVLSGTKKGSLKG